MSRLQRFVASMLASGGLVALALTVALLAGGDAGGDLAADALPFAQSASPLASPFSGAGLEGGNGRPGSSARPTSVAERAASRTRFARLDAAAAVKLARRVFPETVAQTSGGIDLPHGARIARYLAANAARIDLPDGKRALVESAGPMAVQTQAGRWEPVDLGIAERGGVFESVRPKVGVVIPSHLNQGVDLPEGGISLTPVDASGRPLSGSGEAVDGASVLFANTQRDTDTVVKPTVAGFEADSILRSAGSPDRFFYRLGLPAGASLRQLRPGSSAVEVIEDGRELAAVMPPSAEDSAGEPVATSMSLADDTITVSIMGAAERALPIMVDPEVIDTNTEDKEKRPSNWVSEYSNSGNFKVESKLSESETFVKYSSAAPLEPSEWMASTYATQGESRIFNAEAWVYEQVEHGRSLLQILNSGGGEESGMVLDELGSAAWRAVGLCAKKGEEPCKSTSGSASNVLRYKQVELGSDPYLYALYSEFGYAKVYITQEKGPELSYSTAPLVDEGRTNVKYGSGGWLGRNSGAVEMIAHDPGVGISKAGAQELSGGDYHTQIPIYTEGVCKGVQCKETFPNEITYSPEMSDGEDKFELWAEDSLGYFSYTDTTIKVDGTPPHSIKVSGWNATHEISADSHALTFEATDGEGTTPSSGMASISVSVDGGPYSSVPITPCTPGPCTASGKWTLDAEGLSEGVHNLIVTAADNAGNEESEKFTFDVRHGTPVAVGPGTVDPTSGQFKLTASDVSLAGAGSLSRTFESESLTAGAEGPFGPQWQASLGDGQGITVLADGSVVLRSPSGGTTTFWLNEKNEYESPPGDRNLKVEAKEAEAGKGIDEYLLVETKTGSTTRFTQPAGTGSTTPVYTSKFGDEAGHLNTPDGEAIDSSGDLWVADYGNGRIVKFSPQGGVLGSYGSPGSYSGELERPRALAVNPSTGDVYVVDEGNDRIVQLNSSGEFVSTFGWGVSNGKAEYEICSAYYCQAGIAGSGAGQLREPRGIAVDSSGNVWVADYGNNRIQEFHADGEYVGGFGSEGSGEGQLKGPSGIAFSGGDLWVVEAINDRVQELSTAGGYLAQFGKEGTGNSEFKSPSGIFADPSTGNLYVADTGNDRVQELKTNGSLVAKLGSAGAGQGQFEEPRAVAVATSGNIYVVDSANDRISEWSHPTWLPTTSENALKSPTAAYSYEAIEVEGKTVIEPVEELAPAPAKVSCGTKISELKRGCRALSFKYDTGATGAKGLNPGEWGNYKGHLESVKVHMWEPVKGEMIEPTVAEYEYDSQGRLRVEWDPRISPALKTTFGYDEEGRVTAVSPPGGEPWLIHYGALAGDVTTGGRLLSVTRPPAGSSSLLKAQKAMGAPVNTGAPKLSTTTLAVGTTSSVSGEGAWSNSPLSYSYQWYDCTSESAEWHSCTAIAGAVNRTYTPQAQDAGYYLVARVGAQNASGLSYAGTPASKMVPLSAPTYGSLAFGSKGSAGGQTEDPDSAAIDASGDVWITDALNNRIDEFSSGGTFLKTVGWGVSDGKAEAETCAASCRAGLSGSGNGQFDHPFGIAISKITGYIYVTDEYNDRVEELSSTGTFRKAFGEAGTGTGQFGVTTGIAIDPVGNVWVADYENNRIQKLSPEGEVIAVLGWGVKDGKSESEVCTSNCRAGIAGSGNGQFTWPVGMTFSGGNVYVADYSNSRIDELTMSGAYVRQFGSGGSGEGQISQPYGIATEPVSGDIYVGECANNRVQVFTPVGQYVQHLGKHGTGGGEFECAKGMAFTASGELYAVDSNNDRVEKWDQSYSTSNPAPEPPEASSNSTWTVEYRVPLSGGSLPTMTESEVAKWGQKDEPVEAMAMFPPDRPMGWPAKEYESETVDYMDAQGHTVNVASPTGGISTNEYNETNELTRTLSADNRATALKEAKPAEASEKLDTRNTYSEGLLTETLGPEHKVKLQVGKEGKRDEEVSARELTKYYYDEGSPEGKSYGLVTRTVDSALVGGKEEEPRTTRTYYSGQKGLGWTLREPTSVVTDPSGLDLAHTTVYNEATGSVVETKAPGGSSGAVYPPVYSAMFGSEGSGSGQLKTPKLEVFDATGDLWVADMGNNRIEEFSSTGSFLAAYGTLGSGNEQFSGPWGVTVDPKTGYLYVSDTGNNRVQELESNGKYIRTIGTEGAGKLKEPMGATIDSAGNLWVADKADNRIVEYTSTGTFIREVGSLGSGNGQFNAPTDVAISEGSIYVVDAGNDRIEQLSPTGAYLDQFGTKGSGIGQFSEPLAVAVNQTTGDLYISDIGNNRTVEISPAGKVLTEWQAWSESHQLSTSHGLAVSSTGTVYMTNGSVVSEWTLPEAGGANLHYSMQFGSKGSGEGEFTKPESVALDGNDNAWIVDRENDDVQEFSPTGKLIARYGKEGSGEDQFYHPTGIDINQSTGDIYIADSGNNRIEELSSTGTYIRSFGTSGSGQLDYPEGLRISSSGAIWVADTRHDRIVVFSSTGTYVLAFGKEGSGEKQFNEPTDIAISGGDLYVTDRANHRVQELSLVGGYIRQFGTEGPGSGELYNPQAIAADSAGDLYVTDEAGARVEEFSAEGSFRASFGTEGHSEGQLTDPNGIAITPAGNMYIVDAGDNRIEQWANINQAAHDVKTIYYSAEEEAEVATCRNHPEWTNLPCQTMPVGQPSTETAPAIPTSTLVYNALDEIEKTTESFPTSEKFSALTRTKAETYDAAGRALTSEETSTVGTALPTTTNKYNSETGALEEQSTTREGTTKTITSVANTLGQMVSYTDADGSTTKYLYDLDGRVEEVSDPKGKQSYAYDAETGLMTKLVDSSAGVFTATYDVEGKMLTDVLPDGLVAKYAYNAVGMATGLEYEKKASCEKTCPETWFSDTVVPSIHGETLTQVSSLSSESYSYDNLGRLTETQEISSKTCKARVYAYDEEGNRLSETNRESATEICPSEGGAVERHVYDAANRLVDSGVTYDAVGNETKLPAGDAGGHELTSAFYVDDQVATQTQHEETIEYFYDPAGRTRETISKGTTNATAVTHYAGPGEAVSWVSEGGAKWTRNVPGIEGTLAAIESSSGSTMLQLHDLQGNVVGQAGVSESETKPQSLFNNTEFGVPTTGKTPAKYAWLGASGVEAEFETGIVTEGGASYVPQIGRKIQTASVVPPGAFPNGSGPGTVEETVIPGWITAINEKESVAVLAEWAAIQAAEKREAEEKACAVASECVEPEAGGVEVEFYDPEGLASYRRTQERATELRRDALSCDSIALLISAGEADCGSYRDQLTLSAENLEKCAANKKRHPWGVCYIHEERLSDGLGDSIPWEAEAELCTYVRTVQPHQNIYYCPGQHADVWGPWF